jgi:hypothetical protein
MSDAEPLPCVFEDSEGKAVRRDAPRGRPLHATIHRSHGRDGSLFRGRYQAILVAGDEYLAHVVRYNHLDPVGAGLV